MPADRYAQIHAAHRWEVPAQFNIATACCGRWAADRTRFALYWEDESGATSAHPFWDLQREANRLCNVLAALGVARGDKVALILPQRRETAVAHIAVYQMAQSRFRCRSCSAPRRSSTGSPIPQRRWRSWTRSRRPAWRRFAAACRA